MTPLRLGLKYCGGCSPRYDRVDWVSELKQKMGGRIEWVSHDDPYAEAILVVMGCESACVDVSPFEGKPVYPVWKELHLESLILSLKKKLKGNGLMDVMVDLCVVPLGVGVSVSEYVVACQKILDEAGLSHQLHAYGTNIEGEWDAVFAAVKRCHEVIHDMGAPRITTTIKLGTRIDRKQTMLEKVASVTSKL